LLCVWRVGYEDFGYWEVIEFVDVDEEEGIGNREAFMK
jgi:hypothetical protein